MATSQSTVRAEWERSHQETRLLIAGLTPTQLLAPTNYPGWTVQSLAAHIATADEFLVMAGSKVAQGKRVLPVPMPSFLLNKLGDMMNERTVKKHAGASAAELAALLTANHEIAARFLDSLSPDAWQRRGNIPTLGSMTLEQFIATQTKHEQDHGAELRRAIATS